MEKENFLVQPKDRDRMLELISSRRSVFPRSFIDKTISKSDIEKLLQIANTAPTHRLTEPWRFKVLVDGALDRLGDWLAEQYRDSCLDATFSESKYERTRQKARRAGAVILICMQRDPKQSVPEWEEIAAVACAVQNLWIASGALDLGGYWSTPKAIANMDSFTELGAGEKCLGIFYLGHHNQAFVAKKRSSWMEKVTWIS